MFCKNCGNQLAPGVIFCPNCGQRNEEAQQPAQQAPSFSAPTFTPPSYTQAPRPGYNESPLLREAKDHAASSILTMGILGLAFAAFGVIVSFLGIIFSAIALGKARNYAETYGETTGKASVGKGLAIGGLISGIVMTVIYFIYFVVLLSVL